MAAPIPGQLASTARKPLDEKNEVDTYNQLEGTRLVFDGLHTWVKDTQTEYVRRNGVWELVPKSKDLPYEFIGNPANQNIARGPLGSNTFSGSFTRNTFGTLIQGNTVGNNFYHNIIEDNFINNTIGTDFMENHVSHYFTYNTIGNNLQFSTFGIFTTRNNIGNNCSDIHFSSHCNFNTIGDNCYNIQLYNCDHLTIPNGTNNVAYRNNIQIFPVNNSGGGSTAGSFINEFKEHIAISDGVQTITLKDEDTTNTVTPNGVLDVTLLEKPDANGNSGVRKIYPKHYSLNGSTLTIFALVNAKANDRIVGSYYINSTTTPTPQPETIVINSVTAQ